MKKAGIILLVAFLLIAGGYLFLRHYVFRANDYKPKKSIARLPLDLRPALATKLQQWVRDASEGLYRLSLGNVDADLASATVDITDAKILIDSNRMRELDELHVLPDNLYNISVSKLHIEGLGLSDIIYSKNIDLDKIKITNPDVTAYHQPHARIAIQKPSKGLFDQLDHSAIHIAVKEFQLDNGSYSTITHGKTQDGIQLTGITARLHKILIDSTTIHENNRFLFASDATLSCGPIERRTADGLYLFKTGPLILQSASRQLTVRGAALIPQGDREFFRSHNKYRLDRFDINVPRIILREVDWNALFTHGLVNCRTADMYNARLSDFVNDAMPPKPAAKTNNFPYQLFRALPVKISFRQVNFHNLNISYTEFFPPSGREGTLYFNNATARVTNLINDPAHITDNMWCRVYSNSLFMHRIPVEINFGFDMNHYRDGHFTVDIKSGSMEGPVLNAVTEPLALFTVKKGILDSFSARLEGNNHRVDADLSMLYHDLHITPLKKDNGSGELKKRHFFSLFANLFVIKNDNPSKNETRRQHTTVNRDNINSFFHFGWLAIRKGVFKTVGLPEDFKPH